MARSLPPLLRRLAGRTAALCFTSVALLLLFGLPDSAAAQGEVARDTPVGDSERRTVDEVEPVVGVPSALAQFTTGIEDREPIDQVSFVSTVVRTITLFSDLRGFEGQTVVHRWVYAGETMAEVPFEVRGPRWRVWSTKDLLPQWTGDWTVEIVSEKGEVIAAETFTYSAPGA